MIEPDWVDWLYPAPFNLVDIRSWFPEPKDAGERLQDWIEAREEEWQEDYDRASYACGHSSIVKGCGGCDEGAVEFVIEDGSTALRAPRPDDFGGYASGGVRW